LAASIKHKVILTYGTFDLCHEGHVNLLRRAKSLGDYLIVGVSSDAFNQLKNKKAIQSFAERSTAIAALSEVDLVISEYDWSQKIGDILHYGVDIFVMGDDWAGKFDWLKPYCEVKYLPRTAGVSSSLLRSLIHNSVEV